MPWSTARKDPAYGSAKWKRARLAAMRAANWRCQVRIEGICAGAAAEVDHIHGLANDPDHKHLRAVCKPCHNRITAGQGNAAQRGSRPDPQPRLRTQW